MAAKRSKHRRDGNVSSNSEDDGDSEMSSHPLKSVSVTQNMKSKQKKGWVLIIENTTFSLNCPWPVGNDIDALESLFEDYQYNVRVKRNVTATSLMKHIKYYAEKADSLCFMCFISSFGNLSSIKCVGKKKKQRYEDEADVKIEDMLHVANTRRLTNFPKLFFIDACRYENPKKHWLPPVIPGDNFLVGTSCLGGELSFRGSGIGGLYFHYIGEIFRESFPLRRQGADYNRDIDYLLNKVRHEVSEYGRKRGFSQTPIHTNNMHYQLFLQ